MRAGDGSDSGSEYDESSSEPEPDSGDEPEPSWTRSKSRRNDLTNDDDRNDFDLFKFFKFEHMPVDDSDGKSRFDK